jgi:tetratricopeptide (TPR) repeat protein
MRAGLALLGACLAAASPAPRLRAASSRSISVDVLGQTSADSLAQARALVQSHQLDKANELLSELVRHDPGNTEALLELGQVQLEQGLNEDAMTSFETVLSRDAQAKISDTQNGSPKDAQNGPQIVSDASPALAAARDGEVKSALAAALADRKAGLDDSALVCLLRARKFLPESAQILFAFGVQAEGMRIYQDADAALSKAHEISPDDAKVLYALAHVELDEEKMPQAEAHLRAYLAARPEDATAHYGLGLLLHRAMRDDEAKVELERSVTLQPRQTGSYYELGEMALEQNKDAEARDLYMKVLGLAPHHGGALTGMGVVAFRAKDYATAESYLKSAVFYASDYARAHHYYALVLSRMGRQTEADAENARAAELDKEQTRTRRGNFLEVIP